MTTGKTVTLTIQTFVGKGTSLLFNTVSRFVIAFLSRSKHLFIPWPPLPSVVFLEPKKRKSVNASTFYILFTMKCWDWMPWSCVWMLNFKPVFFFFTFLFHLHQEALSLSSSSLSTLRMVSSAYLRLLVFLLEFCLPACDSSGPTFCMMYPAYKLNKQDDNRKPWCTPFPTLKPAYCSMSSSNCCFLTSIQVSEERGKVFYFFYLFQNFPVCSDPQSQRL